MFVRLDRQQETLQKQQELLQVLATIFQRLPLLLGDAAGRWGCERDQTGDPVNQSDRHWKVISDYPFFWEEPNVFLYLTIFLLSLSIKRL